MEISFRTFSIDGSINFEKMTIFASNGNEIPSRKNSNLKLYEFYLRLRAQSDVSYNQNYLKAPTQSSETFSLLLYLANQNRDNLNWSEH